MNNPHSARAGRVLGEFVLVVTGVLVALAVDAYLGARNDRSIELAYVHRLIEAMEHDSTSVDQTETMADGLIPDLEAFSLAIAGGLRASDSAVVGQGLEGRSWAQVYHEYLESPTIWTELVGTGNLALIRDLELRWRMTQWFSGVAPFLEESAREFAAVVVTPDGDLLGTVSPADWPEVSGDFRITAESVRLVDQTELFNVIRRELFATRKLRAELGMRVILDYVLGELRTYASELEGRGST